MNGLGNVLSTKLICLYFNGRFSVPFVFNFSHICIVSWNGWENFSYHGNKIMGKDR